MSLFLRLAESVQKQIGIRVARMHSGSHKEPLKLLRRAEMALVVPEVKSLGCLKQQESFLEWKQSGSGMHGANLFKLPLYVVLDTAYISSL